MSLTFGDARNILAQYAGKGGKCPDDAEVHDFVLKVLQFLLLQGGFGGERKFIFAAVKGWITLPYELEVPLKVRLDGAAATAWNRWFEWFDTGIVEDKRCTDAGKGLQEDPNIYFTVYDLPKPGRLAVLGFYDDYPEASILLQGTDGTGREIYTTEPEGRSYLGERLSIVKGRLTYSKNVFAQITGVSKTKTINYVPLYWYDPESRKRFFLADYAPGETLPEYRRSRVTSPCAQVEKVSVLGRIRLRSSYEDNDRIPFDNRFLMEVAGQRVNAEFNTQQDVAKAKQDTVEGLVKQENAFRRPSVGQPVEFFHPTSAGSIRNVIRHR